MKRNAYTPEVHTKSGKVRGRKVSTVGGKIIYSFTGIPFAQPPVGNLRFKRSNPVQPWSGTLFATDGSKPCIQPNFYNPTSRLRIGSEDCLYLNIFTSQISSNGDQAGHGGQPGGDDNERRKPVIVFIHGGAFVIGSNDDRLYGPEILMDKDIVLVCINYRLGPLGFLSLETDACPGNLGLHDQYLALDWIKNNIAFFNGDADNITLMGESAGAMSALLHSASPFSKHLFHKIIALSGTPSTVFLKPNRTPRLYAHALAQKLGCKEDDPGRVLEFLQEQKVCNILKHCMMFKDWDYPTPQPWLPIQDDFATLPFLPMSFQDAVNSKLASPKPVLYGLCKDEGLFLTSSFHKEKRRVDVLAEQWQEWAPLLFLHKERDLCTETDLDSANKIWQHYFEQRGISLDKNSLPVLKEIFSMAFFVYPLVEDATVMSSNNWDVWIMRLSVPTEFSLMHVVKSPFHKFCLKMAAHAFGAKQFDKKYGVCHGDDLFYLFSFNIPGMPQAIKSKDQKFARSTLLSSISSFTAQSQPLEDYHHHKAGPQKCGNEIEKNPPNSEKCGLKLCKTAADIDLIEIMPDQQIKLSPLPQSELHKDLHFWQDIYSRDKDRTYSVKQITKLHTKVVPFRVE